MYFLCNCCVLSQVVTVAQNVWEDLGHVSFSIPLLVLPLNNNICPKHDWSWPLCLSIVLLDKDVVPCAQAFVSFLCSEHPVFV